ncbi:multiple organellar RNA editing factor 8, chloroplastic/mitochondrial-like [Humulus lupulus]|uniref:multiple organellar RNA editing factor 8, chloroplastic/mitochondrial-like n=1 Tax=Humulus lupulus TaxID=3486 RepID=UPI002B404C5A|nr:multiple organellar RNA editing factor 8, chloroplastic/mitochondrial-like [Humulus lupulus]
MATTSLSRSLPKTLTLASFISRSLSTSPSISIVHSRSSLSLLHRLRPLAGAFVTHGNFSLASNLRCFSSNATSSSLKDPNPNWSNRPPKETILLDGCDFEHWLVVMEPPEGDPTRDDIIDSYIKTLAMVVGSEEEARMKIYSVSTRCYFAFGALVSEELSYKLKELPKVRWVLPDSYLDVKNKDYGGEPFINGEAVPYDPKYHEEWIRNNARANERNRRNDRPRNFDRSRNFERRRENVQNRDFQRGPPPMPNQQNAGPNPHGMPPSGNMGPPPPPNMGPPPPHMGPPLPNMGSPPNRGPPPPHMGPPPPNMGGYPPNNMGQGYPPNPPNKMGGYPPNNMNPPNNYGGMPPPSNNWGGMPPNNYGGPPPSHNTGPPNMGGGPPNMGGMQQGNNGWSGNVPNADNQNSYTPSRDMGNVPGRNYSS